MSARPCPGPRADDERVGTEYAHTAPDDERADATAASARRAHG